MKAKEFDDNNVGYVRFNWYRGVRPDGTVEVFRFLKGGQKALFDKNVADMQLSNISGPYTTRKKASEVQ
ncbi:MAG TPA: hypothetical protein VFM18_17000 [Methanosarcina sp.]|nr:hypothetical protein [Methanosarcina sp.]